MTFYQTCSRCSYCCHLTGLDLGPQGVQDPYDDVLGRRYPCPRGLGRDVRRGDLPLDICHLAVLQDYDLSAVFMRNWDTRDESGTDSGCEWKKDWEDVQRVCRMLGIRCEMVRCTSFSLKKDMPTYDLEDRLVLVQVHGT